MDTDMKVIQSSIIVDEAKKHCVFENKLIRGGIVPLGKIYAR